MFFKKIVSFQKFFLAKARAGVYIDKANTCFPNMKKTFIYLVFSALLGFLPAHAKEVVEATKVHVAINQNKVGSSADLAPLPMPQNDVFKGVKNGVPLSSLSNDEKTAQWHVLNIPITITATGRNAQNKTAPASCVNELTVTAYVIYKTPSAGGKSSSKGSSKSDKGANYSIIEKTITYVNIPLDKSTKVESGNEVGYADMSVGLFIPRTSGFKITGSDVPSDLTKSGVVCAYAVTAMFRGAPCDRVDIKALGSTKAVGVTPNSRIFEPALKKIVGDALWWKGKTHDSMTPSEAEVMCISETPFAPFYYTYYPATKPLYGSPSNSAADSGTPAAPDALPVPPDSGSSSSSSSSSTSSVH